MNINPMQLFQMIKGGQNPQQLVMNILQQKSQTNPILNNAMNLAKNGNQSALWNLARNLAEQRGLDFDKQFGNFKNQFR